MSGISTSPDVSDLPEILEEVIEVEHHLHNKERWLGASAADSLSPYTIASGNNQYGTEVLLLDTGDTPVQAGKTKYDLHRILVIDQSVTSVYKVQLVWGTGTFAAALSAGRYSEFMLIANSTLGLLAGGSPVDVLMPRLNCGADKLWARCWNVTNGADIDFFIGLHEYDA